MDSLPDCLLAYLTGFLSDSSVLPRVNKRFFRHTRPRGYQFYLRTYSNIKALESLRPNIEKIKIVPSEWFWNNDDFFFSLVTSKLFEKVHTMEIEAWDFGHSDIFWKFLTRGFFFKIERLCLKSFIFDPGAIHKLLRYCLSLKKLELIDPRPNTFMTITVGIIVDEVPAGDFLEITGNIGENKFSVKRLNDGIWITESGKNENY